MNSKKQNKTNNKIILENLSFDELSALQPQNQKKALKSLLWAVVSFLLYIIEVSVTGGLVFLVVFICLFISYIKKAMFANKINKLLKNYNPTVNTVPVNDTPLKLDGFVSVEDNNDNNANNIDIASPTNTTVATKPNNFTEIKEFPSRDSSGHRLLKVYELFVTGTLHKHDDSDPQDIIPYLSILDTIILQPDPNNKYDKAAVKVLTEYGDYLGWLPKKADLYDELIKDLKLDVFERLTSGIAVYARVSEIYEIKNHPGKYGFKIEIARYAKR